MKYVGLAIIAAAGATLLLVCAASAPARPAERPKPPTPQEYDAWTSNRFAGSPWEKQALVDEYDLMARNPGVATRDGKILTVFYRGKPVKTFNPAAPPGREAGFDSVILGKVLKLRDKETGRNEAIALIVEHAGEFDWSMLVLADGKILPVGSASASPDGLWLVTGKESVWSDDGNGRDLGRLRIRPWPVRSPSVEFTSHCHVIGWRGNDTFNATCLYRTKHGNGYVSFHARVYRDKDMEWHMASTTQVKADPREAVITEFPDTLLRPLPDPHLRFTGTTKAQ